MVEKKLQESPEKEERNDGQFSAKGEIISSMKKTTRIEKKHA